MLSAEDVIKQLGLAPLPGEGGFFRETYRSPETYTSPSGHEGRSLATVIYYLLTPASFSALHRIDADEIYHFHAGDPVDMYLVDAESLELTRVTLGNRLDRGETCHVLVPRGVWQGSRLAPGGAWSLMGTTVCPGFEFLGHELAHSSTIADWPASIVDEITPLVIPS